MELHVAAPEGTLPFLLLPGWNLVALPFAPSAEDAARLMEMAPFMVTADGIYARAISIEAHRGYWLHVGTQQLLLLERRAASDVPAVGRGWQLVEGSRVNALPAENERHAWEQGRYAETAAPQEGRGYWVKMP